MTEINLVWFGIISISVFVIAAIADWKTKKIDVRSFFFLIGLAYGGFFANNKGIVLALAVSFGLLIIQLVLNWKKVKVLGSGDFPVFQAYNLITMLYAPHIFIFGAFFIVPLIFFGIWHWFFKDRSFVPPITLSLILFFIAMVSWKGFFG